MHPLTLLKMVSYPVVPGSKHQAGGAQPSATGKVAVLQSTENIKALCLPRHRLRHQLPGQTGKRHAVAAEALQVFAPLANRLGIWEIKWEMEDLAFRFLEPDTYKQIARFLDEKRVGREAYMADLRAELETAIRSLGFDAKVAHDFAQQPKEV